MEIEQLNAMAGAATTETTSNELTIHTSFPFPAERLPDNGFLRGYLLGQSEFSVFDTHQPNLAENVGAGARGLVLMPFKAVTGLAGEVGSQYRDLYNLVAGPKNSVPTSALYNSLQREGIGGTLVNMGHSVLSAPVQPVFDVLEGRYEQAGAGVPGMLSTGFGVVRGVRSGGYGAIGNVEMLPSGAGMTRLDIAAEKAYQGIRDVRMADVQAVAENAGLSLQEATTLKKHLFFGRHEYPIDGTTLVRARFVADHEIAYAWQTAAKGPLTDGQRAWFNQLAQHELVERGIMAKGVPYLQQEAWTGSSFGTMPPGAHNLAPRPPNTSFPGYDIPLSLLGD